MGFIQYKVQIPKEYGLKKGVKYLKKRKIKYLSMKSTKNFYEFKLAKGPNKKKDFETGTLIHHDTGIRELEYNYV